MWKYSERRANAAERRRQTRGISPLPFVYSKDTKSLCLTGPAFQILPNHEHSIPCLDILKMHLTYLKVIDVCTIVHFIKSLQTLFNINQITFITLFYYFQENTKF